VGHSSGKRKDTASETPRPSSRPKVSRKPRAESASTTGEPIAPPLSPEPHRVGHGPHRIDDLIEGIHLSADKLVEDEPTRGDLKIIERTIRELRYAFKVFRPYRSTRKITIFGSARTPPGDPCYEQAVKLGRTMAAAGWLVVTGGASGIMEAGHKGAGRERSMGLNIMLPFEQEANAVIADDPKLVHMKYFFTRKLMFVKECHAVCLLPGGFGTLDEGMEVLTLIQTGKRDLIPVVFLDEPGGSFWRDVQRFFRDTLLARGMIAPSDTSLYHVTDNVEEAVAGILGFFHVFHSMRYVYDRLVLRLTRPIGDELLASLNERFVDIVVRGTIHQSGPLGQEKDEPELAALPRLIFHFNRYDFGRLRQLIDCLNAEGPSAE
jgi:uncharacterized protein (TIGR00730 family)